MNPARDGVYPELLDLVDTLVLPDLSLENLQVLRDLFRPPTAEGFDHAIHLIAAGVPTELHVIPAV